MKKLINNIIESKLNIELSQINDEIIYESLQSSILNKLAKQLKSFGSKNQNKWNNKSFSGILGSLSYKWNEVKDSDFIHYEAGDAKGIKLVRQMVTMSDRHIDGICLITNIKNKNEFKYFIYNSRITNLVSYDYYEEKYHPKNSEDLSFSSVKDYCEKSDFYCLKLEGLDTWELHRNRQSSQSGIVLQGDDDYYNKLAKENIERYNKILTKKRATEAAKKDTLSKEVQDILNEVMELSTDSMKNPEKYISCRYAICNLIEEIYSQRHYDRNGGYGYNGLMVLYKRYVDSTLSMSANGGYSFDKKDNENAIKELKSLIQKIEERIDKIKESI